MNLIKKLIIKYKELIVYAVFGVGTTLVDFAVYELFNLALGADFYLLSNIVGWFVSVIFAFVTNKLFVFESKSWKPRLLVREALPFFGARVFSLLIAEAGLFLLVDICGMKEFSLEVMSFNISGETAAKALLSVIVVVLNYFFSKFVVFKKKK